MLLNYKTISFKNFYRQKLNWNISSTLVYIYILIYVPLHGVVMKIKFFFFNVHLLLYYSMDFNDCYILKEAKFYTFSLTIAFKSDNRQFCGIFSKMGICKCDIFP